MRRAGARGRVWAVALAAMLAPALPARADDRPPVVVTDPSARVFRVGLQLFADRDGAGDRPAVLRKEIDAGLLMSNLFASIDPRAFLGPERTRALDDPLPVCADWKTIGTDALVEGELWGGSGSGDPLLHVEYRVWDVSACRSLLRKRYHGEKQEIRKIARRIADDIVGAFTGRLGVASTEIAFVSTRTGNKELYVMDADGENLRRATSNGSINVFPGWSPDGQQVVYTSYREQRRPALYLLARGGGSPGRILRGLNGAAAQYRGVFDPSGERLALVMSVDGAAEIFTVRPDGSGLRRLTRNDVIDVSPTWSPDGRRIAFVSDRAGSPQVYVMSADGRDVRRVTYEGSYNTSPVWSPDGAWIAYESRIDGQMDIWLIDPDGRTNVPLVSHPRDDEGPSWSPDGRMLAFSSKRRGRADIYTVDLGGEEYRRLTLGDGDNTSPAWGPYPR